MTERKVTKIEAEILAADKIKSDIERCGVPDTLSTLAEDVRVDWLEEVGVLKRHKPPNVLSRQQISQAADELSKLIWQRTDQVGTRDDVALTPLHDDSRWGTQTMDDQTEISGRSEILFVQCLRLLSMLLTRDDELCIRWEIKRLG